MKLDLHARCQDKRLAQYHEMRHLQTPRFQATGPPQLSFVLRNVPSEYRNDSERESVCKKDGRATCLNVEEKKDEKAKDAFPVFTQVKNGRKGTQRKEQRQWVNNGVRLGKRINGAPFPLQTLGPF